MFVRRHLPLRLLYLGLAIGLPTSFAKLFNSPSDWRRASQSYDYVIVGGGTAGSVLATRLTENPDVRVLVLEAGVSNVGVLASEVPLLAPTLPGTVYDWNYTTTPQAGYHNRTVGYPRGKLLGGSSSINYMLYSLASLDDWNRYAAVSGDPGWGWDNIQRYIEKIDSFIPPAVNDTATGTYIATSHGFRGQLLTSLPNSPTVVDSRIYESTQQLSSEFSYRADTSGGDGNILGVGWIQTTIGNGERSSAATRYLQPVIDRPNLDVIINAQVTKLIQTGRGRIPSFRAVQFARSTNSSRYTASATQEVILSAGSIGTPAILQLSGIGDPSVLRAAGIRPIVNNPSVGKNLSDHALLPNIFNITANETLDDLFRNPDQFNTALAEWNATKTGPLAHPLNSFVGWMRIPDNSSIYQTERDPSAGPHSAHFEMLFGDRFSNFGQPVPSTGHFLRIATGLISPSSRGTVNIISSNPFIAPAINPNFMSTDFDIFTMIESVKTVKRFISAPAWNGYIVSAFGTLAEANTDAEIEELVRSSAGSIYHPVGTASMSPKGASWGVVDPDLKMKGVSGVRIVDGSVLPYVPSSHAQGPIYLYAERAADMIKAEWVPSASCNRP